jgi:hypothetical protein
VSPCRALLALYVASVALSALVVLAVCNRMLEALQDAQEAAREAVEPPRDLDFPAPPGFYKRTPQPGVVS